MTSTTEPTADEIRELLDYSPSTGEFKWSMSPKNGTKAGRAVGTVATNGYVMIKVLGKVRLAHRLAWLIEFGAWPAFTIDHINRCKQDNRIVNLRDVPHKANVWNRPSKAVLAGARREEDGSWSSVHIEYGEECIQPGFTTAEDANMAFLKAQEGAFQAFGTRPKVRPISPKRRQRRFG